MYDPKAYTEVKRETLATRDVPNGRWGDHHRSVVVATYEDGHEEVRYFDGFSDPLIVETVDEAMEYMRS
jgi:hypothetical protein